jgi:hypothetical protein
MVDGYLTEHFSLTLIFFFFLGYEQRDLDGRNGI